MAEIEVFPDWQGTCRLIGHLYRQPGRGREAVSFQYDNGWIEDIGHVSIDVSLKVGRGLFVPRTGQEKFGTLGDS